MGRLPAAEVRLQIVLSVSSNCSDMFLQLSIEAEFEDEKESEEA